MNLTYVTYFTYDLNAMAEFYVAIGLEEIEASRSNSYREVKAGSAKIGFAAQAAYENLDLACDANPTGSRSLITFDVGHPENVTATVSRVIAAGGELVKPGFETSFGMYLAVVRDPEGNPFRLSAEVKT
jgi:predicted lactoylglutathione lyase